MSFTVSLNALRDQDREFIRANCTIEEKPNQYSKVGKTLYTYDVNSTEKICILPLSLWKNFYEGFPINSEYPPLTSKKFKGTLIENKEKDQKKVIIKALDQLKQNHYCLLALRTGFGKSVVSIYLILKLGLKAVIICHYRSLHMQWLDYFNKFSELKVQVVLKSCKSIGLLDPDADIYIMGAKKAALLNYSFFKDIGTVVVDEVESICTRTFSQSLHNFRPMYLIGCSATPDRRDGLHKMLYNYFGPRESFIFRAGVKAFKVIKCSTNFVPSVRYNYQGTINWVHFISSLSDNELRQEYICKLAITEPYKSQRMIIFVSRISEIKALYSKLKNKGESVDYISGEKKQWDNSARIFIGTYKKIGVGVSVEDRTVTMFAGDTKDIRQPEGRVRLENNTILDIVDKHPILFNHWRQRKNWYITRGATVVENGVEIEEEEPQQETETYANVLPPF
jgi:hypothetical protein